MSQALLLEVKCHLPQDGSKRICSQEGDKMQALCITFENACTNHNGDTDSYNIGIRNIKMMMMEMNGRCEVIQTPERFQVCLRFQYKKD